MRNRFFVVMLAVALAALTLTGCGKKPPEQPQTSVQSQTQPEQSEQKDDTPVKSEPVTSEQTSSAAEPEEWTAQEGTGVNEEFRTLMESYEDCVNRYLDFMSKLEQAEDPMAMMEENAALITEFSEYVERVDALDVQTLNEEELQLMTDVQERVSKRMEDLLGED